MVIQGSSLADVKSSYESEIELSMKACQEGGTVLIITDTKEACIWQLGQYCHIWFVQTRNNQKTWKESTMYRQIILGFNAQYIVKPASVFGTHVHLCCAIRLFKDLKDHWYFLGLNKSENSNNERVFGVSWLYFTNFQSSFHNTKQGLETPHHRLSTPQRFNLQRIG